MMFRLIRTLRVSVGLRRVWYACRRGDAAGHPPAHQPRGRWLLEVTDGKATVMSDWGAGPLADAVEIALESKPAELEMAKRRAEEFTWARMASAIRDLAAEVIKKD